MDLDEEKTAEDRKAASDAVRVEEYLAGQNIIRSGDVVTLDFEDDSFEIAVL